MKTKLLLLLLLANFSLYAQQYTAIPDLNFEKKLIELNIDSGAPDGQVLTSKISALTILDVSSSSITDLTGIQNFVSLKELSCRSNQLTTLDLSKNLALRSLDCSFNALTSLNITQIRDLVDFRCSNNQLANLDIRTNEALKLLICSTNKLTTLDVSKNIALDRLDAVDNKLTTINVSSNINLTNLDLSLNKITSLDLSNNLNLNIFQAYLNELTILDISKNISLENLDCRFNKLTALDISNNSALKILDCSNNLLTSLNTYKNLALNKLTCSTNKISSLDLSKNSALSLVNCSNNSLLNLNLKNGKNTLLNVSTLNFTFNPVLSCIQVDDLAYSNTNWSSPAIKLPSTLYSSNCNQYTSIPDPSFEDKLINLGIDTDGKNGLVLTTNINSVTTLNVNNSNIKDLTGIEDFVSLKELYCSSNKLKNLDLTKNSSLTTLNTTGNTELTCIKVTNITTANNWNTLKDSFTSFNTDCNAYTLIPDSKFEQKLIALGYDTDGLNGKVATSNIASITFLNVSNSSITNLSGIEDFVALRNLNCSTNPIVSLNLTKNIDLITLACNGNSGSPYDGGNGKLTSLNLSSNVNLQKLDCSYNQISSLNLSGCTQLTEVKSDINKLTGFSSVSTKLFIVNLYGNKIASLDLSNNTGLAYLNCAFNNLQTLDLSKNTKLTALDCSNNSQLKSLNIRNGNNISFSTYTGYFPVNFKSNASLTCIKVDDETYSNANWATFKNETTSYSNDCEPYTLIPDPNFEDALILMQIDKDGKNGKVKTASISSLTSLDVSDSNIADLTGIQDFISLETLNCYGNKLTTLNVSKNVYLSTLNCSRNLLTSLNTAQNTELKYLTCSNNKLASLSLTNNPKLKKLQTNNNLLTALSLTSQTLLEDLNCDKNSLTALNVDANKDLTSLSFTQNQITSIVLTQNKSLKDLTCWQNKLTALDVSKNIALVSLYCDSNKIAKLDLSSNVNLENLTCSSNSLTELNLKNGNNAKINKSQLDLRTNPNLSCIQVDNVEFSNTNWLSVAKDATANYNIDCTVYTLIPDINFETKLISLGIDSGTPDGKVITSKISSVPSLDLYNSNITDLTGIADFQSLTTLSVMSNKLTTVDLTKNVALTNLNVGYNKLTTLNTSKNIALEYLSLYNNEIVSLDFSQNANLNLLSCGSNKLTTIDVSNNKKLSMLLCASNLLTSLDVSKNIALTSLQCSENKLLTSVNLRNGNNSKMQLDSYNIDFTKNPSLTCIIIDNPIYSNEKWVSFKDVSASYSTVDCAQVTAIPDPAFEDKLIALNIDKDGRNGSVLNTSISSLTSLDVSSSSIKDLTGIKGFTSLTNLNCSGNLLTFLDLSKNASLTIVNSNNNKLLSLNLKNGNNINLNLSSNFKNNPDLNCIQVDDEILSTNNWSTIKDAVASYSLDCNVYTLIPDSNFEDKLIALEIDKDGKNGKVLTSSINKVTRLDISSSNISDLTGIKDFIALTYLDCNYNKISNINISNSKSLTKLALHDNKLTSLNVTQNVNLYNLMFSKNQISTIDLSQNKELHILSCDRNLLNTLNIAANTKIESLWCGENNLTTLDVSNQPNLLQLNCIYTTISTIDVSSNPKLEMLYFNNAKLTTIDLTQNPRLKSLNLSRNELTTLDISKNPLLELVFIEFNPLTSLNLQNGNNQNFILPSSSGTGKNSATLDVCSFLNNKKLSCIQVDNVEFSNANWAKIKDATATYSATCSLGIEDSVFDKVVMYPNPTKGEVNINNISLEKATVYNSLGQLVKSFVFNSGYTNNTINLSGLPRGIYYVYLISEDAASAKKVIVE